MLKSKERVIDRYRDNLRNSAIRNDSRDRSALLKGQVLSGFRSKNIYGDLFTYIF